jgi:hypothetical protein
MTFEILSVAENDGDSNSISAVQRHYRLSQGVSEVVDELFLKIDVKRNFTIKISRGGKLQNIIQFTGVDLNSLIQYIEDVRTFISEEEMIERLKGKLAL